MGKVHLTQAGIPLSYKPFRDTGEEHLLLTRAPVLTASRSGICDLVTKAE